MRPTKYKTGCTQFLRLFNSNACNSRWLRLPWSAPLRVALLILGRRGLLATIGSFGHTLIKSMCRFHYS